MFPKVFPFTVEGRRTTMYLTFAASGAALSAMLIWALITIRDFAGASADERLKAFAALSLWLAYALMITLVTYASYISIKEIKVTPTSLDAKGGDTGL